jgi:hypothetical protein
MSPPPEAGESRGAVAITVAWMLLALCCLMAQATALATWLLARAVAPPGRTNHLLLVPRTLLGVALLTALLILVFTPLTHRVRKSRPPMAVTIAAIAIAVVPLLTVIVAAVMG